jgi:hypothetical protein
VACERTFASVVEIRHEHDPIDHRHLALAGSGTIPSPGKAQMLRIVAACDIADMVATVITRRQGNVTKLGTGLWLVASGACLAMTIAAIREQ